MILQEITLSGWRCFADACRVGPLDTGLNVIHAPNGSGKSTVFEALRMAFFDSYKVGGQEVENILPWGRGLSPEVCVRFEEKGVEYELIKQFINSPSARLRRKEAGNYVALAENRDADEQLRALFAGSAPGRGLSKPTHWGLAQILWAPQGQLPLEQINGDLVHQVQALLGNEQHSGQASKLEQAVDQLFAQYYTQAGKLKSGKNAPPILRLETERVEVAEAYSAALAVLEDFESTSRKIEELQSAFDRFREQEQDLEARRSRLQTQAHEYNALQQEQRSLEKDAASAAAAYEKWDKFLKDRQKQDATLRQLQAEQTSLQAQCDQAASTLAEREAAHQQRESALLALRREASEIEAAQRTAEQARRYRENAEAIKQLHTRITHIEQARKALETAQKNRAQLVAPSASELEALRQAFKEKEQCQIRLEALMISLEITPLRALRVQDLLDTNDTAQALEPNTPQTFRGEQQVALRLDDVAEIRAAGPGADTASLRSEQERLARTIASILQPYGNIPLDDLEALHRKAAALDGDVREAATKLDTYLDAQAPEDLALERARREAEQTQLLQQYPDWEAQPPDPTQLETEAEQRRKAFQERLVTTEEQEILARSTRDSAKEQAQELRLRLEECVRRARGIADEIQLEEANGHTLDTLQAHCQEAAMQYRAAQGTLELKTAALAEFEGNPQEDLQALERQLAGIEEEARNNRDKLHQEKGRLAHLVDARAYSRVAELEERLSALDETIVRERQRLEAIKLLKEFKDQISSARMHGIVEPVAAAAGRLLERVAGSRLGSVRLDDSFAPTGVRPRIWAGTEAPAEQVTLDNLSGGEQEQLHFVTRLALAETLADEERQLVVMDDVLTATDAGRLGRVLKLLEEAAEQLQIIVLTCHPERYRGLDAAQFLDLETRKTPV